MSQITIAIAGNPNCGKTTVFNALTGSRQRVGNWPGVTVERLEGNYKHADHDVMAVDLPGIYSFSANSPDEEVARSYILKSSRMWSSTSLMRRISNEISISRPNSWT